VFGQLRSYIPLPLGEESPRRIGNRYVGEAGEPRHSSAFGRGKPEAYRKPIRWRGRCATTFLSLCFGRGQPSVSEAGEGVFNPNLEFIRPSSPSLRSGTSPGGRRMRGSSPFASLGYFSRREKIVVAHRPCCASSPQPTHCPPSRGTRSAATEGVAVVCEPLNGALTAPAGARAPLPERRERNALASEATEGVVVVSQLYIGP